MTSTPSRSAIPEPRAPRPAAATFPGSERDGDDIGPAVLVTGAGGPAGIAVVRRLVALGRRVVAADADPAAAGLRLAPEGVLLPRADHPRFGDALLGVVATYGVDALIGTVAEELPAILAVEPRLAAVGVHTWLPDLEAVRLCCDKAAFADRLEAAGVPHPPTAAMPVDVIDVPGPWIVKPREGRGSRGVQLLDNAWQVVDAMVADPELIAQTRLGGREFTADALVGRHGELITVVPRWREETKAGISVQGSTFDSEAVTDVVVGALSAVALTGPANVQGFVADDGTVTIVEINPRFSGGLPLTLAAGADVVSAYLAGVRDEHADLPFLYFTPGVRMSRYFAETYARADGVPVEDPCAAPSVVRSPFAGVSR